MLGRRLVGAPGRCLPRPCLPLGLPHLRFTALDTWDNQCGCACVSCKDDRGRVLFGTGANWR